MKSSFSKILIVVLAGIGLFSSHAIAVERTVDCDKGQSIQAALEKGQGSAEPLAINVTGTCKEYVSITRDDVSIYGNKTATVEGTIEILGGMRILVDGISLKGPNIGLHVFGGHVELRDANVTGNTYGVAVNRNAFLSVYDSNISNNTIDGLHVIVGSTVEVHNTDLLNNTGNGIEVDRHSTADIRDGCKISGNANGINLWLHSSAFITETEISANRENGILMNNDSGVIALSPVTISGNTSYGVLCYDTESSFETNDTLADTVNCTGFSY